MVKISTIFLLYSGDKLVRAFERTNFNFTTALGVGTDLSATYRVLFRRLRVDRAQLYTADPSGPDELYTDESYAQARNLRRLDLKSTGAQIVERSRIAAPLVVLKLFL